MRVAVCVITLNRLNGLAATMRALARQKLPAGVEMSLVIVDNDSNGSARDTVARNAAEMGLSVKYDIEPQRGIPFARNRSVAVARTTGADFLSFTDDDMEVSDDWVSELLRVQGEYGADVVAGPVTLNISSAAPSWVKEGKFFDRPNHQTGSEIRAFGTGNVLIRALLFDTYRFDTRFALCGGEDTFLSFQLRRAGAKMLWSNLAIVQDNIPSSRCTSHWLVSRAFRMGTTLGMCARLLPATPVELMRRIAIAILQILEGVLRFIPALFGGRRHFVRALQRVARGSGTLYGILGGTYSEYRVVHGS